MEVNVGSFAVCPTHQVTGLHGEPFAYAFRDDDARLIAAAPELLEALKGLLRPLENEDDLAAAYRACVVAAEAAIRKATEAAS